MLGLNTIMIGGINLGTWQRGVLPIAPNFIKLYKRVQSYLTLLGFIGWGFMYM